MGKLKYALLGNFRPCCGLRAACCVLRAACCVLRAACCVLRAACCVLRAACCVPRASMNQTMGIHSFNFSTVLRAACKYELAFILTRTHTFGLAPILCNASSINALTTPT